MVAIIKDIAINTFSKGIVLRLSTAVYQPPLNIITVILIYLSILK